MLTDKHIVQYMLIPCVLGETVRAMHTAQSVSDRKVGDNLGMIVDASINEQLIHLDYKKSFKLSRRTQKLANDCVRVFNIKDDNVHRFITYILWIKQLTESCRLIPGDGSNLSILIDRLALFIKDVSIDYDTERGEIQIKELNEICKRKEIFLNPE